MARVIVKACFIATDAISFNVLYSDQLEFLHGNHFELTLLCGGGQENIQKLTNRKVGRVIDMGMVRPPNPLVDFLCLIKIWWHLLFNRYDLVVVTTPKAILLGSVAAYFSRQKCCIVFFRGRVYENFKGIRRKIYTFLDYLSVLFSNHSLFVSPSLKHEFSKDIPLVKSKGSVIGFGSGNGVNEEFFNSHIVDKKLISSLRKKLNIAMDDVVVLSIGRVCEDKGMFEIAEIAHRLSLINKKCRFVMLGGVEDQRFYSKFHHLIEIGTVLHVEHVDDIRPYLSLADIHLFLTHREGFGNVAIEAAAMNVPTFAYDVVGVRDSVAEGISGIKFPYKDINSVCNALQYFVNNPVLLNQKFHGARAWAQVHYSQKKVWENYKKYYISVLEK